jgi:hypothetical protein
VGSSNSEPWNSGYFDHLRRGYLGSDDIVNAELFGAYKVPLEVRDEYCSGNPGEDTLSKFESLMGDANKA